MAESFVEVSDRAKRAAAYAREWRKANPGSHKRYYETQRRWRTAKRQDPEWVAAERLKGRERNARLRSEMLDAYGRLCVCCGEAEEAFLSLDHIQKDGSKHRRDKGGYLGILYDLKARGWPTEGYRILCMNCNTASYRMGTCPHQMKNV